MRNAKTFIITGCVAILLTSASFLYVSASPSQSTTSFPSLPVSSNRPQVFTLRYVTFIGQPRTTEVASQEPGIPSFYGSLNRNRRYAMTTTPEDFQTVLAVDQPGYDFKISTAGSIVMTNGVATQIIDGPNPADPYGLTLRDKIIINQNSETTLDFVSQGTFSYRSLGSGDFGGKAHWNGENNALQIGRTYPWGVSKKPDGTIVTWAFCILPGNLDQVTSIWKRTNGVRAKR